MKDDLITIGVIARPNGLRGAVVAHIDPSMADELRRGLRIQLTGPFGSLASRIRELAPARSGMRLVLEAVGDRETAESIVGATIGVARKDLRGVGGDVYLDSDLLGAQAVTRDNTVLGTVAEILSTGANDIYVVRGPAGDILVPAIARAIIEVDIGARRIVVEADALEYPDAGAGEPDERRPSGKKRKRPPQSTTE